MPNVQNLGHRLNKNKILGTVSGCCKYKENQDVLAGFFFPLNQYLRCHVDMSSNISHTYNDNEQAPKDTVDL